MLKSEAKCWKIERTPAKHENPIRFYSIKYKLKRNHHNSLDMVTVGYWTAGFQAEVVCYTPDRRTCSFSSITANKIFTC